jgi:hypothetical protein
MRFLHCWGGAALEPVAFLAKMTSFQPLQTKHETTLSPFLFVATKNLRPSV